MNKTGIIYGVNGPVIYLKGDPGFKISEMVYVGPEKLVGEVIGLKKGMTTVQVFEETTGLKPGDTVIGTGDAISVLLGPGIIHNIFDGIQRPLEEIAKSSGQYISRGVSVDSLDTEKKMGNTHYSKRRRCHRRRYGYRRDTGNRFYSSQIHGSSYNRSSRSYLSCTGWCLHHS